MTKKENFIDKIYFPITYSRTVNFILRILMLAIVLAIVGGTIKTIFDLELLFHDQLEEAMRKILVDVLIILAVVEVMRTVQLYITEGHVRVTFVIDTVLIVMLNEIMSLWFKGESSLQQYFALILLLAVLIIMRFLSRRFYSEKE